MRNILGRRFNNIQSGLPKGQAIVVAFIVTIFGYFALRGLADQWINPTAFFLVWIIFFTMIHNQTLDKPDDLYDYKIELKDFIDEADLIDWLKKEGAEGWSAVALRPDAEVNERYRILLKRKFYFEPVK